MPNDAKLGLLAGVIGVIVAAVSVNGGLPVPANPVAEAAGVPSPPPEKPDPKPPAAPEVAGSPATLTAGLTAMPVVKSSPEPEGTPAGRGPRTRGGP